MPVSPNELMPNSFNIIFNLVLVSITESIYICTISKLFIRYSATVFERVLLSCANLNLDITDKCLIIFGLYLIVSSINKSEYLMFIFLRNYFQNVKQLLKNLIQDTNLE